MKTLYLQICILFIALSNSIYAQTPEKLAYQAIIRNSEDIILTNQSIGIQVSILQSSANGSAVYVETQNPSTNENGLITIEIGNGNIISGTFNTIDWSNDTYFIKTEIDPEGGGNYTITGTSQLLSVPYALQAKTAETINGTLSINKIADLQDELDAKLETEIDDDTTNEIQDFEEVLTEGNNANGKSILNAGQISIGTESPNTSAALDITSTTGALLLPRLSETQRDGLTATAGMVIYNTDINKFQGYTPLVLAGQDGTGITSGQATYDGPAMGQTITPLSSGILKSIEAQVAIRASAGSIEIKIYDAPNGNLIATSDNTVDDSDSSSFTFVNGTWTFDNDSLNLSASTTYYVEFTATNGNRIYIQTDRNDSYSRGEHYSGSQGSVVERAGMDLNFILTYGETSGGWIDLH